MSQDPTSEHEPQETASTPPGSTSSHDTAQAEPDKSSVFILWALYGIGVISGGFVTLCGVIFAYIKKGSARNAFEDSHCRYAIRTFWYSLLWTVVGLALSFIGVGVFILVIAAIWYIYRVIKGLIRASEGAEI
ncbi:DUF4870 family protein [Aidingimonas lacisalsi]|uniref:DUF4870 family protein n=1 Tax=Aidingimonas lacisalsi TaxID=2604086 RepID=UPI0011D2C152|nr:hypothetical protein [Aidingimonas lacisalsi]